MTGMEDKIHNTLENLRNSTGTDFAALALADEKQAIRWKYASGNRNNRFRRIVLRLGKGIAGKVIASGRPMLIDSFVLQSGDDPRDYPIMLAENLQAALGVPIDIQGRVSGVLLIGYRKPQTISSGVVEEVTRSALQIGSIISQQRSEQ